jgi:hypothetical protein
MPRISPRIFAATIGSTPQIARRWVQCRARSRSRISRSSLPVALEGGEAVERLDCESAACWVVLSSAARGRAGAADASRRGQRARCRLVAGCGDAEQRVRAVAPAAGRDDQLVACISEQLQLIVEDARVETREPLLVAQPDRRHH